MGTRDEKRCQKKARVVPTRKQDRGDSRNRTSLVRAADKTTTFIISVMRHTKTMAVTESVEVPKNIF